MKSFLPALRRFPPLRLRPWRMPDMKLNWYLTQPDRPAGRGMKIDASAVKLLAQERKLALAAARLAQASPNCMQIGRDWCRCHGGSGLWADLTLGRFKHSKVWLPEYSCIVTAALAGRRPIQRAILAGDRETGITIMQMDQGLGYRRHSIAAPYL